MRTRFLNADWKNLILVSYEVDAGILEKYVPEGTVLDDYEGRHYVSVVAFEFERTSFLGIPIPICRHFPEINLRFYVRSKEKEGWRRGVVFVKEVIPLKLPAWVARKVFRENFHHLDLEVKKDGRGVSYGWGEGEVIESGPITCESSTERGSFEEYIVDRDWAYQKVGEGKTLEFHVDHEEWKVARCDEARVDFEVGKLYGERWKKAMGEPVQEVLFTSGCRVGVTRPRSVELSRARVVGGNINREEERELWRDELRWN